MRHLRIRAEDPRAQPAQFFGRVPASVLEDDELSPTATVVYAAITLLMIQDRNSTHCLASMREIGHQAGRITERHARKMVAQLEARGHVERERVRTRKGSPQGIRPLAELRRKAQPLHASNRSDSTDCNRSDSTGNPVHSDREPGPLRPGTRSIQTAPLKRGGEKDLDSIRFAPPTPAAGLNSPPPSASLDPANTPEEIAGLQELASMPGPIGRMAQAKLRDLGARSSPGEVLADQPGATSEGNSIPSERDSTESTPQPSRPELDREHNAH